MEQHQYEALRADILEIKHAIKGNPITMDGGMNKRLREVETTTEEHKKFINRLKWSGGLLVGLATFIGYLFEKFTSLFHSSNH